MTDKLRQAAQALVDRWDTPLWKDVAHTGQYIEALRLALADDPIYIASDGKFYPIPRQRKPLSDEQLDFMWRQLMSADWEHREFARAIEKEHGIIP